MTDPQTAVDASVPSGAARVDPGGIDSRPAVRGWIDAVLLVVLLVVAVGFRAARGPVASAVYPSIMDRPTSLRYSDAPSIDETLNLTLSTGRGAGLYSYPRDTLVVGVPAWTSLTDAPAWWNVWTRMDEVTHPPLYMLTLRWWRECFGESDRVAIAYSVAWSCVALVFVYLAALSAVGRPAAFWTGALLAVAPIASYYALEIRGYAMLSAEAAVAIWLLVRLTRHGPRWRDVIGLCVTLLACMLTHYFAAIACLAAGVYALVVAGRRWPRVLACGILTAGVYAVVWVPFLLRQLRVAQEGTGFLQTAEAQFWFNLAFAVALPTRLFAETWSVPMEVVLAAGVAILAGVTIAAVRRPAVRPFVLWFFALAGGHLIADTLRQTQQLAFIRYSAAAQPAAAVFLPVIAAVLFRRTWAIHVVGVAICAGVLMMQPNAMHNDAPTLTPAAATLAGELGPDDVLLIHTWRPPEQNDYLSASLVQEFAHVPGCFPRDVAILNGPVSPALAERLRGRTAWLLMVEPITTREQIAPQARVLAEKRYRLTIVSAKPQTAYRLAFEPSPTTTVSP